MTTHDPSVTAAPSSNANGLVVLRRIAAVLLLMVSVALLFTVGTLQTVNAIAGKPAEVVDTGLSVITSPGPAKALATQLVTQLQKDAGDDTRLAFVEHKDAFIAAVEKVIQDPQVRAMARADLLRAYDAINAGKKITIEVKPIVTRFTTALHRVDARIPAAPKDFKNMTLTIDKKVEYLSVVDKLNVAVWAVTIFGFAMAILVSRFLIRNRVRRVIAVGLALFLPTAMLFSGAAFIGGLPASWDIKDHEIEVLATALAKHVGGVLLGTAVVFLIITGVVVGVFLLANKRAARSNPDLASSFNGLAASDVSPLTAEPAVLVSSEQGGEALPPPPRNVEA